MDGGNKVRQKKKKKKELALWNPKLPRRFAICISADLLAGKREQPRKSVSQSGVGKLQRCHFPSTLTLKMQRTPSRKKQPADLCLSVSASFPHLTFLCITMSTMSISGLLESCDALGHFQFPKYLRKSDSASNTK